MGDLFHDDHNMVYTPRDEVFVTMAKNNYHTYMLLTKRPETMVKYFKSECEKSIRDAIPNLYLGVTVENQDHIGRIDALLKLHKYAKVLFVSIEPMLGPVDFIVDQANDQVNHTHNLLSGEWFEFDRHDNQRGGYYEDMKLDWVICGAETGPGKRQMKIEWALDLQAQCKSAGVPFFFKKDSAGSLLLTGELCWELPEVKG
jgi:protein gp37